MLKVQVYCVVVVFSLVLLSPASGGALFRSRARSTVVSELKSEIEHDFRGNNFQGVIEKYHRYRKKNPEDYVPLIIKSYYSESLAKTGQVREAIVALNEMISELPVHLDLVRMQNNLANLLFMEDRQQEARVAYEKVILMAEEHDDYITTARERLASMKQKVVGRRDKVALELFDIESILEAGEIPVGAEEYLNTVLAKGSGDENSEKAKLLLEKTDQLKDTKARTLLNEARRLFDEERKYAEVRELLGTILRDYPDTSEKRSIETLMQEVDKRSPR